MEILTLLDRFYSYNKKFKEDYLSKALLQLIKEKISDYDAEIEYIDMYSPGNRPRIAIKGKDEKYVMNFVKKMYGTIYNFDELKVGMVIRGRMKDPESVNFGIFLDCGIELPKTNENDRPENKDVLLPLFSLREQLIDGKKAPKKKICKVFGFFEEMPVYVKITKIDKVSKKIECEFAEETLNNLKTWEEDGFEILFSTGIPRKQVKKAIKRTSHYPDYITIDRIGFLETMIFLKKGTHAPGILAEIGPILKNVKFSMFRPSVIRHLRSEF